MLLRYKNFEQRLHSNSITIGRSIKCDSKSVSERFHAMGKPQEEGK